MFAVTPGSLRVLSGASRVQGTVGIITGFAAPAPGTPPPAAACGRARARNQRSDVVYLRRTGSELSQPVQSQQARQHHALDLGRALADLQDLGVAVEPGDGVLVHEPVAAEHLRRVPGV